MFDVCLKPLCRSYKNLMWAARENRNNWNIPCHYIITVDLVCPHIKHAATAMSSFARTWNKNIPKNWMWYNSNKTIINLLAEFHYTTFSNFMTLIKKKRKNDNNYVDPFFPLNQIFKRNLTMLMRFYRKLARWPKNKLALITGSLLTSCLQKYKHCNQPLLQNLDEIISQFLQFLIWLWVKEHIIWDE